MKMVLGALGYRLWSLHASGRDSPATSGELALIGQLWPLLVATFVANMAGTAINLFIAPIATELGTTTAVVGGFRAFNGIAALGVGFGLAPLIDRVPRAATVVAGLLLIALAVTISTSGSLTGLVVFYVVMGATLAFLQPTLQAASADRLDGPASGKALAIIVSIPSLASILTGPLLVLPSLIGGWHGAFDSIAAGCVLVALLVAPALSWHRPENVTRMGYRAAFAVVAQAPGAVALLTLSAFRNCLWLGWITYLAAFFTERFAGTTGLVAWVWFLGASAFFAATVVTGRSTNVRENEDFSGRSSPVRFLKVCVPANLLLAPLVYISPTVPLALIATIAFCVTSGATMSALSSLLIRRYVPIRGAMMGLNGVGMNVGMIAGAMIAGLGLGLGGYAGLAMTLVLLGIPAIWALLCVLRVSDARRPVEA